MNTPRPSTPHGDPRPNRDHAERLLGARLRNATPEFEARFEALQQRLANERAGNWRSLLPAWLRGARGWATLATATAAGAAAIVLLMFQPPAPSVQPLPADQAAAFGELLLLDDTLRDALPLTDDETLYMTSEILFHGLGTSPTTSAARLKVVWRVLAPRFLSRKWAKNSDVVYRSSFNSAIPEPRLTQ